MAVLARNFTALKETLDRDRYPGAPTGIQVLARR
jgi:hypothetical protein